MMGAAGAEAAGVADGARDITLYAFAWGPREPVAVWSFLGDTPPAAPLLILLPQRPSWWGCEPTDGGASVSAKVSV